ncbi:WD40-repeat-containing domain protein [Cryomyces antarcticus]|uniref:Beta transducin n=1 Tax=Cryomyces antarcticus TaxID=329879 RepID=A0ABR0LQN7_9PEZI|nr:beta transducin [Cryomyces antarcticus]
MVRSYRKYEQAQSFGVINSGSANVVWTAEGPTSGASTARTTGAGRAYVGANEEVLCWDVKKGELLSRWHDSDCKAAATVIARSPTQEDVYAVGYGDGSIRVWDAVTANIIISFNGHRSAVTKLVFDNGGSRLASGAKDTDIIVWNLVSELAEFKLRGHKDQITGLHFIQTKTSRRQSPHTDEGVDVGTSDEDDEMEEKFVLSTSKDALIKIWDIDTPHCIETHVAQTNGECWSLGVSSDGRVCITAGNDGELKVWSIDLEGLSDAAHQIGERKESRYLHDQGVLNRQGKDRTEGICFHPRAGYIAIHGSEKAVELWRIRSGEEIQRSIARKRKRRREKAAATEEAEPTEGTPEDIASAEVSEVFVPYVIVRTGGRVQSVDWVVGRGHKEIQLLVATKNNQLETFSVVSKERAKKKSTSEPPDYNRTHSVDIPGHGTDIRSLALSSDDRMLASASTGSLKLWNVNTRSCLRTLECGEALCCAFLPGDKIILVGTKTGELELYDIASSALIEKVQAHEGPIWTLQVHPDGRSVVTGSADKSAKFWNFEVIQEEIPGTRRTTPRLKLAQTRVLKVANDILNLCLSPDSRLLVVALLDQTVKVFFTDSLKLCHNLYGHNLPVLKMSISSDSKLIATCSADKSIRIWGLDFGDVHKTFKVAHQDSVMQVAFIPHPVEKEESHLLFSAGRDHIVKTWDGDKFEQIQKLEGHHRDVMAMTISRTGEKFVTASLDKSIRVWGVTNDLIFLEEERERELEEMYESTLATQLDRDYANEEDGDENEVAAASKQTIATLTHGEKIMEALELGYEDFQLVREWEFEKTRNPSLAAPARNPLFGALGNISAEQHILNTISRIPGASLNDALLVIPFSTIPTLFTFISIFLERRMSPEIAWRVFHFMLQIHNAQIVASRTLKSVLQDILRSFQKWVREDQGMIGFNMAALRHLTLEVRDAEVTGIEEEEDMEERLDKGRKKRAFTSIA